MTSGRRTLTRLRLGFTGLEASLMGLIYSDSAGAPIVICHRRSVGVALRFRAFSPEMGNPVTQESPSTYCLERIDHFDQSGHLLTAILKEDRES